MAHLKPVDVEHDVAQIVFGGMLLTLFKNVHSPRLVAHEEVGLRDICVEVAFQTVTLQ